MTIRRALVTTGIRYLLTANTPKLMMYGTAEDLIPFAQLLSDTGRIYYLTKLGIVNEKASAQSEIELDALVLED